MKTTTKSKLKAQLKDFSKLNYQLLIEKQELIKKCKYRILSTIVLSMICVFVTNIILKVAFLLYLILTLKTNLYIFDWIAEYGILILICLILITSGTLYIGIFINKMYKYISEW